MSSCRATNSHPIYLYTDPEASLPPSKGSRTMGTSSSWIITATIKGVFSNGGLVSPLPHGRLVPILCTLLHIQLQQHPRCLYVHRRLQVGWCNISNDVKYPPTLRHLWKLPGNYRDFVRVMVFHLFCRRSMRILVTVVFCHLLYIYTFINDIYIREPPGNNFEITMAHYIYTYWYINKMIYNGNLFSWSCLFSANIC